MLAAIAATVPRPRTPVKSFGATPAARGHARDKHILRAAFLHCDTTFGVSRI
jgi:hypothetical protein